MRHFCLTFCFALFCLELWSQDILSLSVERAQYLKNREKWVDSVFNNLSDQQRIGQLFMVAAYSNRDEKHTAEIEKLITEYGIGGLIFFQGTPTKQAQLTNHFQAVSKVPLFIAIDGEWGLAMRLDSTISYPRQLTLGAQSDTKLIYEMGRDIARQCKRIGIHINFAPVVDVNSNPNNPVIGDRSFGEDKLNVSLKALAYMEGMQHEGVMACAKHFPGHGDTDSDSHLTLPVIKHDRQRLEAVELYPFKVLFNNGVQSIMAAHIHIPQLDNTPNLAASLSPKVTTTLLKKEMGFEGIVFSDALNMKGVSNFYGPGEVDLLAFKAGNDVMLFAEDVPVGVKLFSEALKTGEIEKEHLYGSVKKILAGKFDAGLNNYKPIALQGLTADLNSSYSLWLRQKLFEESMTLVSNANDLIPFKNIDSAGFASVSIGAKEQTPFQNMLSNYAPFQHFQIQKAAAVTEFQQLEKQLSAYQTVIVGVHDMSRQVSKNFGLTPQSIQFIQALSQKTKVVLVVFGSPYSLKNFEGQQWLLMAYDEQPAAQEVAAMALFGGVATKGQLPVTASQKFPAGDGIFTPPPIRLKYTYPEETGIRSSDLRNIEDIARLAIADRAMPGCQVLVAKDGNVIYNRSFGSHIFEKNIPVKNSDLYDVASLTKVLASTISLMRLHEERKFQINRTFADYLDGMEKSQLRNIIMKDVLIHQAGLKAWLPFTRFTRITEQNKNIYNQRKEGSYTLEVARDLYLRNDYADSIYNQILLSELSPKPAYLYSDLGFILFRLVVERISKVKFEDYTAAEFYKPLGLATMTFRPLEKFDEARIVPTENDQLFRKQLLKGHVHDPVAAMLGGVSGHAGLFSNANDVAIVMQMLLNKGEYGGQRFFSPTTVALFTRRHEENNRRGLGFDKPEIDIYKPKPTAASASPRTFGHSGFTGTCTWVDPDHNLIYVFLSNRVYPSAENNKLMKNNIRTQIHQVIYDAIKAGENRTLTQSE